MIYDRTIAFAESLQRYVQIYDKSFTNQMNPGLVNEVKNSNKNDNNDNNNSKIIIIIIIIIIILITAIIIITLFTVDKDIVYTIRYKLVSIS